MVPFTRDYRWTSPPDVLFVLWILTAITLALRLSPAAQFVVGTSPIYGRGRRAGLRATKPG